MTDRPTHRIHQPSPTWTHDAETRCAQNYVETPTSTLYGGDAHAAGHEDPMAWSQDTRDDDDPISAHYYAQAGADGHGSPWFRSAPTLLMALAVVAVLSAGGGLAYTLTGSSRQDHAPAPAQPQPAQQAVEPAPVPEAPPPVPDQPPPAAPEAPAPVEPAYSGPVYSAPDDGTAPVPAAEPPAPAPVQQQDPEQIDPNQQRPGPQQMPGAILQPPIGHQPGETKDLPNKQQPAGTQNLPNNQKPGGNKDLPNQQPGGTQNLPGSPADAAPGEQKQSGTSGKQQQTSPNDTLCSPKPSPC